MLSGPSTDISLDEKLDLSDLQLNDEQIAAIKQYSSDLFFRNTEKVRELTDFHETTVRSIYESNVNVLSSICYKLGIIVR